MSRVAILADRYAKALFQSVTNKELALSELRVIVSILIKDKTTFDFFQSKAQSDLVKRSVLEKATQSAGISEGVRSFVLLLAQKGRLALVSDILSRFESQVDSLNGVLRGSVKSAVKLDIDSRARIEKVVSHYINKKVILTYSEDPLLVGGVVAQVGGWTFEDTLESHLTRLKEELNRRAN